MECKRFFVVVAAVSLCLAPGEIAASVGQAPATVSPGELEEFSAVLGPCPTFSWGEVDGTSSYELAVYLADEGSEEGPPLLLERLPGSVESFTPPLGHCPEDGGRYAWSVRAIGSRGASEWSQPRLFEVASGAAPFDEPDSVAFEPSVVVEVEGAPGLVPLGVDEGSQGPTPPKTGGADLSVSGTLEAGLLIGNGSGLTGVTASGLTCSGCVGSADISANAVTSTEIVGSAVKGSEIDTIRIVSVECNGSCADTTLSQICNALGSGYEALMVDCTTVDDDSSSPHVACGSGDSRCFVNTVFSSAPLTNFCTRVSGWDAQVYCISTL